MGPLGASLHRRCRWNIGSGDTAEHEAVPRAQRVSTRRCWYLSQVAALLGLFRQRSLVESVAVAIAARASPQSMKLGRGVMRISTWMCWHLTQVAALLGYLGHA